MSTRKKLGLLLWGAGMTGVVSVSVLVLPMLLETLPKMIGRDLPPLPVPMWVLVLASIFQSGIYLALATWAGIALSPAVGLRAPVFEAIVAREPIRFQLLPGVIAGIIGGAVLIACGRLAPSAVQAVQSRIAMPLAARVLYGGITEEVLLRWGFMTLVAWLAWRFARRTPAWMWVAIVVSALVFAAGHLPGAFILVGPLTATIVAYVLVVNTIFGIAFGWLYWRYGLETAIVAHALTHVVSYLVSG
ncbi:MAG TPA: CPBP family glutamic-type intramembrane protease [Thermoanaerobaculia bacterium]|jgi:membrane protease YdiL (CAAX protease family)|nr:CPBP family glutamic-type intramembrane protease [Thermoanaerobaculia bacterium]